MHVRYQNVVHNERFVKPIYTHQYNWDLKCEIRKLNSYNTKFAKTNKTYFHNTLTKRENINFLVQIFESMTTSF